MADLTRLLPPPFEYEAELQRWLAAHPDALEAGLWVVGYEFPLGENRADLVAVDSDGRLVVIEVKRANATREAVAQVLDYVSALEVMEVEEIADIVNDAEARPEFARVVDFERELVGRYPGVGASNLVPVRALLACTSESPETGRMLRFLQDLGMEIDSVVFEGALMDGERTYRRKPLPGAAHDIARPTNTERCRASKPKPGTAGRRNIDEVHDGVEDFAAAGYAGAKLFTEVHCAVVSALYEGTEEARVITGETFGIVVKMRATESDPQKSEADYVTVRFYPDRPDEVMLYVFEAARRRAVETSERLFALSELDPYESDRPLGTIIWFNQRTWAANSELFGQLLHDAKGAWEAERAAGRA